MLGVHLLVDCSGWTGLNMTDHAWALTRRYRLHAYRVSPCDWTKVPEWSSHGAMGPCTRPRGHLQTCLLCMCAEDGYKIDLRNTSVENSAFSAPSPSVSRRKQRLEEREKGVVWGGGRAPTQHNNPSSMNTARGIVNLLATYLASE